LLRSVLCSAVKIRAVSAAGEGRAESAEFPARETGEEKARSADGSAARSEIKDSTEHDGIEGELKDFH
jgi:hypothetical protein